MARDAVIPHDGGTVANVCIHAIDGQLLAVLLRQPIDDRPYLGSRRSAVGVNQNQRGLIRHRQGWGRPTAAGRQQKSCRDEKWDQDEDEGWRSIETRRGSYSRSIALPEDVEADKIKATMKKGVLRLTLPKTPEVEQKPREIEIR